LSEIATKHKVSITSLKHANNLTGNLIKVGQELLIKAPKSGPKSTPVRKLNYQVRNGDSLYLIAKRFELKITDIKSWNKLDSSKYLQPGQRLTLYINPLRI
jgi:membrane-bound lytic murein transglycosylase D